MDAAALVTPYNHISFKRRKNTWYTIASGNWSDPNIWMSNSHRRYSYPSFVLGGQNSSPTTMSQYVTANDDVFINHNVTLDVSTASLNSILVNNLYISGSLSINSSQVRGVTVVGNLQATGSLDLSSGTSHIALYGTNNYVSNFISGAASTINYVRTGDQFIMDLPYRNLGLYGFNTKSLTNDLTVAGNVVMASTALTMECGTYNMTVNGTTTQTGGVISKTGAGSILFVGQYSFSTGLITGVNFTGNPTVEFRGGINVNNGTQSNLVWNTGTSLWSFTTNTQTITFSSSTYSFTCPISVVGAITLNEAGTGIMSLNQPIDCTSSSGSVVAKGTIYFNSTSSLPSFTTGTFDRTSFANTVGYTMGASITLPYTSYSSLYVSNSGTKTSLGNTTLSGNLLVSNTIAGSAVYELSTFDLSVTGTTSVSPTCKLSKNGAGNVLFAGNLGWANTGGGTDIKIDFSGGNPSVECRGGITQTNGSNDVVKTGTGQWKFTTNSQSITTAGGAGYIIFSGSILVSGVINVTVTRGGATDYAMYVNTVNGDNAASTFTIGANGQVYLLTSTLPMATGAFSYNSVSTATLGFAFSGDYTIPYTSFGGLAIGSSLATSTGTKTLSANTTTSGNLIVNNSGTSSANILELSSFNLTVSGTTTSTYQISKTGAGSVIFIGQVSLFQTNLAASATAINFTGGGSLEMRGGLSLSNDTGVTSTGTLTFSTNNQSLTAGNSFSSINCQTIISGAITLTYATTNQSITITNILNGNNAASTFDNRGTVNYQATQQPMLTGVLQTNLAANTFIYNGNNSQNISGGTYRTMQIGGTATPNNKTLQGNIVVATAYSVSGNAVLVLNGFTKT